MYKFYHKKGKRYKCVSDAVCNDIKDEDLPQLLNVDYNREYFFISYNSIHKKDVWTFCSQNETLLKNYWIDKKQVADRWNEDVEKAFSCENCKYALMFINKQYLIRSTACFSEAKKIVDKALPHIIILLDIDENYVISTIKSWIENDAADKDKLITFKKIFYYNEDTGHLDNSVFVLSDKNLELIKESIIKTICKYSSN